jgi:hypothetical protein
MGRGKSKRQRPAAAKHNHNIPRNGEKHKQQRRHSDSDSDRNKDLFDTPDSNQKPNGPRTRSNDVASTRKQLFKKATKLQTLSDEESNQDTHPKTKGQLKTTGLDSDSESSHSETERISYKRITDPEDELDDAQDKNEIVSIQDETSEEHHQYKNDTDINNSNTDI